MIGSKILFTKKLTSCQININKKWDIDDYSFIQIKPLKFCLPKELPNYFIFTSTNSIILSEKILRKQKAIANKMVYTVGEKTSEYAKKIFKHNLIIVAKGNNSKELIKNIKEDNSDDFLYLCGRNRLPYIEQYLKNENKTFKVLEIYDTLLTPPDNLNTDEYHTLCFCSPSAVKSYVMKYQINDWHKTIAIGKTTAIELEAYTNNIQIADTPSVEAIIKTL